MSMKDKSIRIDDWACNLLYIGAYDSPEVDEVLDANRCGVCGDDGEEYKDGKYITCTQCQGTGYSGDFEVRWVDEENNRYNVYEYINY